MNAELIALRKRLVTEWNAWRIKCKEELAHDRRRRGLKVEEKKREEAKEEIEVWVDDLIEQIEEEVIE